MQKDNDSLIDVAVCFYLEMAEQSLNYVTVIVVHDLKK